MQATPVSIHHESAHQLAEISAKFSQDFQLKLTLDEEHEDDQFEKSEQGELDSISEEEEEEEFSFAVSNPDGSPVSADQAFENGQIRPIYPLFDQNLLYQAFDDDKQRKQLRSPVRKVFMEDQSSSEVVVGPYCEWSGKAVEATPGSCKKSNSTGFSKLWRSREFSHRSNSDGKDAFVMFNNNNPNCLPPPPTTTATTTRKKKINDVKGKGTSSQPHRSYLPYRVGLFTSVHGMSRNLHPY